MLQLNRYASLCSLVTLVAAGIAGAAGCVMEPDEDAVGIDGDELTAAQALLVERCAQAPATGPARGWRRLRNNLVALQGPKHRGKDLMAAASAGTQTLTGEISYGLADKALEGEEVEVFACVAGAWRMVGGAVTNGNGAFSVALTGAKRLSPGARDMYVSVVGDRTGARFTALVVPPAGLATFVSDIDGTLTSSENAYAIALATGGSVSAHPDAARALHAAVAKGYFPVYLTSRGDVFTGDTRAWLAARGLPFGLVRLADSVITLPGDATAAYKTEALRAFTAAGASFGLGFGNRASDVTAFRAAGVPGARVLVKLPEYDSELRGPIAAGNAKGFTNYADTLSTIAALPQP